jgi:hypothetical protein
LINFFDLVYSVTTFEFNLIEAVLETFWRLRLPTISRVSVGSFVPTPTFPLTVKLLESSTFPLIVASPLTVKLLESSTFPLTVKLLDISTFPLTVKLLVTSKFSPTETFETDVSVVVCMSAPGKFMMCVDII